jgi:DNA replication protein DnaC
MTFESFVPEGYGLNAERRKNLRDTYALARAFANDPQGWLILTGGYGSGKTHLGAAIANYRLERGDGVLFVFVPDLLDHLRAAFAPDSAISYDQRFEQVRETPLLILDDLGVESATPWAKEKLLQILNHRYNARLPTVITTNRRLEDLDPRLRSRMIDPELCQVRHILAHDYRTSGIRDADSINTLSHLRDKTFESFSLRRGELDAEKRANLKRAVEIAQEFARQPHGWLVYTGEFGCGKTHLAAAIANYRENQGHSPLFVVVPDLLDHLRATFAPDSAVSYDQRFEQVRESPLLILDDLGVESTTPWAREKLFQILNHRYNARLPTVITTNRRLEDIEPRLRARMLDLSLSTIFAIIAPNYSGGRPSRRRTRSQRA